MSVPTSNQLAGQRHVAKTSDLGALADLMEHRDDEQILSFPFHSTGENNAIGSINLGGHKSIKSRPPDQGRNLTYHNKAANVAQPDNYFSGALNSTKFNQGFQRRMEGDCKNELKEREQAYFAAAVVKKEANIAVRREEVARKVHERGFDMITGKPFPGAVIATEKPSMRQCGDGLGPEASHRGNAMLRDSVVGRFHRAQESGNNHDARQDMMGREGLNGPRLSGVLGPEKGEMQSYGVEDNFSKSKYNPNPALNSTLGLAETTVAGKFTPRQQPGNVSGDPVGRANWAKGFQLG